MFAEAVETSDQKIQHMGINIDKALSYRGIVLLQERLGVLIVFQCCKAQGGYGGKRQM